MPSVPHQTLTLEWRLSLAVALIVLLRPCVLFRFHSSPHKVTQRQGILLFVPSAPEQRRHWEAALVSDTETMRCMVVLRA